MQPIFQTEVVKHYSMQILPFLLCFVKKFPEESAYVKHFFTNNIHHRVFLVIGTGFPWRRSRQVGFPKGLRACFRGQKAGLRIDQRRFDAFRGDEIRRSGMRIERPKKHCTDTKRAGGACEAGISARIIPHPYR